MDDEDEKTPRKRRYIPVHLPPEFLQEAAKRGVPPELLLGRLGELVLEADNEARQLFDDWETRSKDSQLRFCLDAARERVRLEFPYLDDNPN